MAGYLREKEKKLECDKHSCSSGLGGFSSPPKLTYVEWRFQPLLYGLGEVACQDKNGMLPLPEIASHAAQNSSQRIELTVTQVHLVDDFVPAEMLVTPPWAVA
jgi:hypothetical protein